MTRRLVSDLSLASSSAWGSVWSGGCERSGIGSFGSSLPCHERLLRDNPLRDDQRREGTGWGEWARTSRRAPTRSGGCRTPAVCRGSVPWSASTVTHRERQGARMARREEDAHRDVSDRRAGRSHAGNIGVRRPPYLRTRAPSRWSPVESEASPHPRQWASTRELMCERAISMSTHERLPSSGAAWRSATGDGCVTHPNDRLLALGNPSGVPRVPLVVPEVAGHLQPFRRKG